MNQDNFTRSTKNLPKGWAVHVDNGPNPRSFSVFKDGVKVAWGTNWSVPTSINHVSDEENHHRLVDDVMYYKNISDIHDQNERDAERSLKLRKEEDEAREAAKKVLDSDV